MKYVQTLILIAILSSCGTYHHGNFNKQKFTKLKSIDAQSATVKENNLALKSDIELNDVAIVNSTLNTELPVTSEKTVQPEKTQEANNTTKQIVSKKISTVKKRVIQTASKLKNLLSIKRIQEKQAKNGGAMAAGIIGAIIFFCLAAICGLFAWAFIEIGFSGLFWGAAAGVCILLAIIFLVIALTQGS